MNKAIVILATLFFSMLVAAYANPSGRGHMNRGMMEYEHGYYGLSAHTALKLTAEQAARIQALDEKYEQEIKHIKRQLYSKGRELKSEWMQARPNRDKITIHQSEVRNLRNQIREKMAVHRADVFNILTPEQRAQMRDDRHSFYKQAGLGRQ